LTDFGSDKNQVSLKAENPAFDTKNSVLDTKNRAFDVMGRGGLEPPTHGFSVRCSTN
jgi:hypothetical protein